MSVRESIGGRGLLAFIATRRTWLMPLIYYIYTYSGLTFEELKELTNLRSRVLRRALWWLKKYGVVEESGQKYIISTEYADAVRELTLRYCIVDKKHMFQLGKTYFVVSIKRSRITSYTVPVDLVQKLHELEENIDSEFKPLHLAQALNIPLNLARRVVNTYRLLRECWRK